MHNILVPTDFSENATLALRYAVHIASEAGFNIHLVHVYEKPLLERYLNDEVVKPLPEPLRDEMFNKFIKEALELWEGPEKPGITCAVREGKVAAEIEKYARETNPLLIIMGSQGSGSDQWDALLLGGTAQKIVRRMIIPVMLVPPKAHYRPVRRICYATDFSPGETEIISELLGFARNFKAQVIAVHIKEDKWDVKDSNLEYIKSKFGEEILAGALRLEIEECKDVMQGLNKFVDDNDISLLVLLKRFHNLWDRLVDRSMALNIALHTQVPSIVFKEN